MPTDNLTYQQSGYFTKIIIDYLNQDETVKPFYNRFPTLENFKTQIEEKTTNYLNKNRIILSSTIKNQYNLVDTTPLVTKNILLLADENTFTITTGHQLNLFTGPLYFLYKIISTINLCKKLKATYPEQNFVPIYWMATEDHDFEEINYFNYKNKKIKWSKTSNGPVGRLSTTGLQDVLKVFETQLGTSTNAKYLINVFEKSYLNHQNLAAATRYLANKLFKNDGLVIIDADSKPLKKLFIPYFKQELLQQSSYITVTETNNQLINYSIQVNPREINLFYIENNLRERIIFENGNFKINNTKIIFSSQEILDELENFPEKFSPNVLLRPLYQEVILPNLAYIGGGGELAYWLQLKAMFKLFKTTFP
ncbi:MAG: bacillithiol biosynthesis cysteine-adding enzyme BshC, partial [Flavobacterium sp.]|nr:bacillithiol biosynthesis cysteine-adding enzyme BshC [Flavobacterium sp.]